MNTIRSVTAMILRDLNLAKGAFKLSDKIWPYHNKTRVSLTHTKCIIINMYSFECDSYQWQPCSRPRQPSECQAPQVEKQMLSE
jgi:hypothetical protein